MTTLATRARTAHYRGITTAREEVVTFQRGSKTCTVTHAVRAEQTDDIIGPDGVITHHASVDWLLPQAEVLIDTEAVEPRINDRVLPSDGKVYETMKQGVNLPAVVPHCGSLFWLVHTKRTKE